MPLWLIRTECFAVVISVISTLTRTLRVRLKTGLLTGVKLVQVRSNAPRWSTASHLASHIGSELAVGGGRQPHFIETIQIGLMLHKHIKLYLEFSYYSGFFNKQILQLGTNIRIANLIWFQIKCSSTSYYKSAGCQKN